MTPIERVLAALRAKGCTPRKSGKGWSCRCPAHDDQDPSLSINVGDDGRVLIKCHAGCTVDAVCGEIGLRPADLFTDAPSRRMRHAPKTRRRGDGDETTRKPARDGDSVAGAREVPPNAEGRTFDTAHEGVADLERWRGPHSVTWPYHDATGELVGLIVRWDRPPKESGNEPKKEIQPVSRLAAGWANKGMPTPRPLYRLPDLLTAPAGARVYVTEGEKAADAARAVGLVATTSPHGSQSAAQADWSPMAGRDVVILPDHDRAGEKYAEDVARLCIAAGAKSVRIVRLVERWTGMPKGGDMADFIEHRGGDAETVRAEVEDHAGRTEPTKPKAARIDGAPVIVRLSDVKPEPVAWLWPGRIALGKLTLIAGDPGLGKSFVTLDLAARVSRGAAWPDIPGVAITPGGVVLLNAEDGVADTIRPRLDAAGAVVSRIVVLHAVCSVRASGDRSERTFDLSRDLPTLEAAIEAEEHCRLVVIDPITAYLGGVDSHNNADVRGLLAPLSAIAERHGVAMVAVTHLNKSGGGSAIYRTMGSLAFPAAARAVWAVSKVPDDPNRRLFLPVKNNIAPDTGGLAYRIEAAGEDGCAAVVWEPDAVTLSADDALTVHRNGGGDRTERDDAADWLREYLSDGPKSARMGLKESQEAGFSKRTIDRAKAVAGVRTRKEAFSSGWVWELDVPGEARHARAEGRHPSDGGNLGQKLGESGGILPKIATAEVVATFNESEDGTGERGDAEGWADV